MATTTLKAQTDKIQNKWISHTSSGSVKHIIYNGLVNIMKKGEGNIDGGISLTTESYMIITNIFKTINLKKQ